METAWLDDVLVLLEERNLTRAAMRRNVTQPAFSRRIRCFEDWLGVPVLARGSNRVEIDPALAANEEEIRSLLARLDRLRSKIAQHDPEAVLLQIAAQHASTASCYPEMAVRARADLPRLRLRVHARNLDECVRLVLRGDAEILLCHEARRAPPLRLGEGIARAVWGRDDLVPVIGGALRAALDPSGEVPSDLPAIVYPEESHFGAALAAGARPFGTAATSRVTACETAFSSGIREMVLAGLGLGWLPFRMVRREIAAGTLVSLADRLGSEPMEIAVHAVAASEPATALLHLWTEGGEAVARPRDTGPPAP